MSNEKQTLTVASDHDFTSSSPTPTPGSINAALRSAEKAAETSDLAISAEDRLVAAVEDKIVEILMRAAGGHIKPMDQPVVAASMGHSIATLQAASVKALTKLTYETMRQHAERAGWYVASKK